MTPSVTARPPAPLGPVLRRPGLTAAITVAGAALGLIIALLTPTTYTAETRLAVGTGELSNLSIPGYPDASAEIASDYARWVTETGAGGEVLTEGDVTLAASPIPDSNVIRVEAHSGDPDAAVTTADAAAAALTAEVNSVRAQDDPANVMTEIQAHAPEVVVAENRSTMLGNIYRGVLAEFQTGTVSPEGLATARDEYTNAYTEWLTLQTEQNARVARYQRLVSQQTSEADLSVIQPAAVSGNDRVSNLQRFALVGLVGGGVAALAVTHLLERRDRRRAGSDAEGSAGPGGAEGSTGTVRDDVVEPAERATVPDEPAHADARPEAPRDHRHAPDGVEPAGSSRTRRART